MEPHLDLPVRMVERLSGYRRHLRFWLGEARDRIYSHELGALVGSTPAQVRRDLMTIGFTGSPARGYDVAALVEKIGTLLDPPGHERMVLVGLGYLGRAVLRYISTTHPELPIVAAFDVAPDKVGRVIDGCRCYASAEIEDVLGEAGALVGIIAVPPEAAQGVADHLVQAGIRGLLNFTPVRLQVPPEVTVEDVDISVSLEKVAFFARSKVSRLEKQA
jgi:redox-sensing transcriptional repressor